MSAKKLGAVDSTANTNHTIYTVPTGKSVVFNINICNTNSSTAYVSISIGGDTIEYEAALSQNKVMERTALIAEAGEAIVCTSTQEHTIFRAYGIEE